MRLIDADWIVDSDIANCLGAEYCCCLPDVRDMLNDQPTAFDVEKVLNELKHEESEALRRYSESKGTAYAFSDKCSCDNWAKAIEIVKRGGVDENKEQTNACYGCFGAANGDCDECAKDWSDYYDKRR